MVGTCGDSIIHFVAEPHLHFPLVLGQRLSQNILTHFAIPYIHCQFGHVTETISQYLCPALTYLLTCQLATFRSSSLNHLLESRHRNISAQSPQKSNHEESTPSTISIEKWNGVYHCIEVIHGNAALVKQSHEVYTVYHLCTGSCPI